MIYLKVKINNVDDTIEYKICSFVKWLRHEDENFDMQKIGQGKENKFEN